jgi:alkanesulfonate monooxygenase SsuD/methylene tetrahydromethanopterin reductase-like flavin-dependent oxidoreductase (luciferase family)
MKFGVFAGPIYPGEMDPAEAFELALAIARTAHESGFDVIAAEATAFLDVMCGGRLLFGVGRGYRAVELESLRIPRVERGERLVEAVQAVRTLWADDPASLEGRFYQFTDVSIRPRPIQRPGRPCGSGRTR